MMMQRILVIQAAALGHNLVQTLKPDMQIAGLELHPLQPVFPAVTCTAQATFRTATTPDQHGMVGNGFFDRTYHKALFWEQSSSLYHGQRIWDSFRQRGGTVGQMFWQQSLGQDSDLILSPAPIHKHGGGMIQDCFSKPAELYPALASKIGKFGLQNYWGPLASARSTQWITAATCEVMASEFAPDLLLTYLPHLDYGLQKSGPSAAAAGKEFGVLQSCLETIVAGATENDYAVLLFGDYAIADVSRPVFPNQLLLDNDLLHVRHVKNMQYPDLHTSNAFAVVDHQVAHVICDSPAATAAAQELLAAQPDIELVLDRDAQAAHNIDHARAGELVLLAAPGAWFAYPWWHTRRQAPDYATHVDIHNKPGYDPCELFFGPFLGTSQNHARIRGSHGRIDSNAVYGTNLELQSREPGTLVDLAAALGEVLDA